MRMAVTMSRIVTISVAALFIYGTVVSSGQLLSVSEIASSPLSKLKLNSLTLSHLSDWLNSWAPLKDMPRAERLQLLLMENEWKNRLVMWMFPESVQAALPHLVHTWLRCWILCAAVYFMVGAIWCYYGYFCFGDKLYAAGEIPAWRDVSEQIRVSSWAMPLYSLLPTLAEMAAEKGWTMAYPRVDNVGLPLYVVYFVLYMVSVEFCVYWMHRGLHEIKWAYKYLHYDHHKYNKEHTLSPFAGLAFHPLDGILQAIPYASTLLYCPMHFLTHEILLFATGIWTANIHDNIHGNVWPVMGAGYHTVHHTNYKTNYGHYFVFMDQIFGTLESPEEVQARKCVKKEIKVVGNLPEVGEWQIDQAPDMNWSAGHAWSLDLEMPRTPLEFKIAVVTGGDILWETGPNRTIQPLDSMVTSIEVTCLFGQPEDTEVVVTGARPAAPAHAPEMSHTANASDLSEAAAAAAAASDMMPVDAPPPSTDTQPVEPARAVCESPAAPELEAPQAKAMLPMTAPDTVSTPVGPAPTSLACSDVDTAPSAAELEMPPQPDGALPEFGALPAPVAPDIALPPPVIPLLPCVSDQAPVEPIQVADAVQVNTAKPDTTPDATVAASPAHEQNSLATQATATGAGVPKEVSKGAGVTGQPPAPVIGGMDALVVEVESGVVVETPTGKIQILHYD